MNPTTLSQIAKWSGGRLESGAAGTLAAKVCTDSRALLPGAFFVAIKGDNFDGHAFVAQAARAGAVGAMVQEIPADLPADFGVVKVDDTLLGLQSLATHYRESLDVKVIGITGSNGKTSTKDATAAVMGRRFRTARTEGNLNNHLGVPLTLLALDSSIEVAVVEMGMNHAGELAPLAAMAKPDAAIVTNVGVAHIEFLGTRDAIANEKSVLPEAVRRGGHVILNADDEYTPLIAARCRAHVTTAGIQAGDVRGSDITPLSSGTKFRIHATGQCVDAELPVPGEHMVRNALLACAAGLAFGIPLEECAAGLADLQLSKGRLQQKTIGGLLVLDDSYNANPDSVVAGLATLAQLPGSGRRIAVLGRMGELGSEAEAGHRRVGEMAGYLGIACVIAIGDEAAWIAESAQKAGVRTVLKAPSTDEAAHALRDYAREGDIALVKGSRSARMERVIQALEILEKGGIA